MYIYITLNETQTEQISKKPQNNTHHIKMFLKEGDEGNNLKRSLSTKWHIM